MSTYLYLECPAHPEPVRAEDESGQHLYDLAAIRFDWLRRDHWLAYIDRFPRALAPGQDHHFTYFSKRTWQFLIEHRGCVTAPYVISEYGERFSIEAPTVGALLSETGSYT